MRILVEDVMTADVAAVREDTALRQLAELMVVRKVSGLPVVDSECRVVGVVSEADLMHREAYTHRSRSDDRGLPLWLRILGRQEPSEGTVALRAADLMSSPAVTIRFGESVLTAARRMEYHQVKRLPVLDHDDRLCGIISRRDVLRVFLRGDKELARRVRRDVLAIAIPRDDGMVHVDVDNGVVTLSGTVRKHSHAKAVVRLTQDVDGVVGVIDQLAVGDAVARI